MCHAKYHGIFRRDICLSQRKIKLSTEGLHTREVQGEVDFRNHCDFGPRGGRSELVSFVHGEQIMTETGYGSWLVACNDDDLSELKKASLVIQNNL